VSPVRRRCVFYVSGFDPKGARYYHGLYKEQAALQSAVNGMPLDVGPRRSVPGGGACWDVRAATDRGEVQTHYEFLPWDDIVRDNWPKNQLELWWKVVVTNLFYLRCGALWKMYQCSWPSAAAVFVPFLILLGLFIGMPVAAACAGWLVSHWTTQALAAGSVAALVAVLLVWLAHRLEARYSLYWMMRSFAFTAHQARGERPALEARLDALAARLVARSESAAYDEVLVVGHSSGAIMAASVLARALRQAPQLATYPGRTLSLLTLGQCIPLLGLVPQAQAFRQELALLGATDGLHWIDFSAPPDGCCFALVDPLEACGLAPATGRPKLLSPRFAEMFDAGEYRALRHNKLRMHFQYLRAGPRPQAYDYFLITAGASTLADRFASIPGVVGYAQLRPFGPPPRGPESGSPPA
jgi:hypothetical protein